VAVCSKNGINGYSAGNYQLMYKGIHEWNGIPPGIKSFKIFSIPTLYFFLTELSTASYSFTPVFSKTAASAYTRLLLTGVQ
jgi:hypothetical protein